MITARTWTTPDYIKDCPVCKAPVFLRDNGRIVSHYRFGGGKCPANEKVYVEPSFPLWIYLHQTRAWERHESSTPALRDYLRAVWRSAGHATAVER